MLKIKILSIILIIFTILNIFTVYSSAFVFSNGNENIDLGENIESKILSYCIVVWNSDKPSFAHLYTSDVPFIMKKSNDNIYSLSSTGVYSWYYFTDIENKNYISYEERGKVGEITSFFQFTSYTPSEVKYSSHDVYTDNGDLAFLKPVQPLGVVLANSNPVKKFQITTSGIILSLTVFLVSLVAFWKGWSILLKSLRKA